MNAIKNREELNPPSLEGRGWGRVADFQCVNICREFSPPPQPSPLKGEGVREEWCKYVTAH